MLKKHVEGNDDGKEKDIDDYDIMMMMMGIEIITTIDIIITIMIIIIMTTLMIIMMIELPYFRAADISFSRVTEWLSLD